MCSWPLPASISLGQTAFACGGASWRSHRASARARIPAGLIASCLLGGLDGFITRVSEMPQGVSEQKLGAKSPPGGSPPAGTRGHRFHQRTFLPVRILKKRYAGSRLNAAVQVLAAGGVTGENAAAVAATGGGRAGDDMGLFRQAADIKMVVSA